MEVNNKMIKAYVYYPNPKISVHNNPNCSLIGQHQKNQQRYIKIDISSVTIELQKFKNKHYIFNSTATNNDMWIEIDFNDPVFEMNLLDYVRKLISIHYKPFFQISINIHC